MTGRILAVDLGQKRIGLAVSDPLGLTAQGLDTILRDSGGSEIDQIKKICLDQQIVLCIVGLPLMMSGEIGDHAKTVLEWTEKLKNALSDTGCEVATHDERLTSKQAEKLMIHQDLSRHRRKHQSDRLAAILILQNYLDRLAFEKRAETDDDIDYP